MIDATERVRKDAEALTLPVRLGRLELANRVVMAPMTRGRATENATPPPTAPLYYAQRASAGLIVTEGTCVSRQGVGNPDVPGIWSAGQVEAWKGVTTAVHDRGGTIVLQLWHTGRASLPEFQADGGSPVGPSAIAIDGSTFTHAGMESFVEPRALARDEIRGTLDDFRRGAENAIDAGFDGVEIHGANGYLIDQFLHDGSNRRDDDYGGSVANRSRFLEEVIDAVSAACGPDRVGLRLSPSSKFYDMADSDPFALYSHVLERLDGVGLAFLHIVEPGISGSLSVDPRTGSGPPIDSAWVRERWSGGLIAAGGYTREKAVEVIESNQADAVAFGRLFVSNPDLPERLAAAAQLNVPDRETFYGGGDVGYVDYPSLEAERVREQLKESANGDLDPSTDLSAVEPLGPGTPLASWPIAWALHHANRAEAESS